MGTTVATNALLERKGEPHGALHHARLPRRAAHRLPEPPAHLRPPHPRCPSCCTSEVVEVDERVGARGEVRDAARRGAARARPGGGLRARASAPSPSSSCTATAIPAHEARVAELAREAGFTQVSVSPRGQPADEARRRAATRRWSTPTSRRSCGATSTRWPAELPGARLHVHAVERRPDRRAPLPGQGLDPLRARRAASSAWCARRRRRASTRSSASTWAARRPTCRTTPASSSATSRRRWPACACARR